jgi:hypothetical protein
LLWLLAVRKKKLLLPQLHRPLRLLLRLLKLPLRLLLRPLLLRLLPTLLLLRLLLLRPLPTLLLLRPLRLLLRLLPSNLRLLEPKADPMGRLFYCNALSSPANSPRFTLKCKTPDASHQAPFNSLTVQQ